MATWEKALRNVHVLLLEDDPDTREVLTLGLELSGARVSAFERADAALANYGHLRPHVVVSDIGLPGEDGLSFIRRLRALPADRGGAVPAIAVTAYTLGDDRMAALRAGFDEFVAKPVETQALIDCVARFAREGRAVTRRPPERRQLDRRRAALPYPSQRRRFDRRARPL